jgi:hypothetical protein
LELFTTNNMQKVAYLKREGVAAQIINGDASLVSYNVSYKNKAIIVMQYVNRGK